LFLPSCQARWIKIATKVFELSFTADVLLSEITPWVLGHVRSFLSSNVGSVVADVFDSDTGSQFWLKMIEAIKDPYAVERMSELLLHHLAAEHASDVEAYWTLWLLFHRTFRHQTSVRLVSTLPS
jgi:telomere length regulation protein